MEVKPNDIKTRTDLVKYRALTIRTACLHALC